MKKVQLFLAGDSTMSHYEASAFPRMGWGQALQNFFTDELIVKNHAASGRSTKSFINENRWAVMEREFSEGDYVLIQFGHNDQKPDEARATKPFTTYQENLRFFIHRARSFGVTPILLTSIARRHFDKDGKLLETHGEYPRAMRELAVREGIIFIDMLENTKEALINLGPERSKDWFMWVDPNQYEGYPDGEKDDTHLRAEGAHAHAKIFIEEIVRFNHPLCKYIKSEVTK
ncbi:Lysophospholipase L1 [Gracilibacillus ureilyticus]|uniref:Lysophospholipase L1 n=1 Tax=Gracilibacillus ureilyticus TaxID=531814 RepID=A0A1H9MZL5_9BACI|nr:rhamnogalacturonan acetylesterase [Gracilibacillus ureilyticus]SER28919.1 Lysophospholipase L1 [Gracilibacillus ureilyticus]